MLKRYLFFIFLLALAVLFYSGSANAAGDAFDLSQAVIVSSTPDIASWPVTTTLDINPSLDSTTFEFDKRMDGGWPDQPDPAYGQDGIKYAMWVFFNINSKWYGAAFAQAWGDQNSVGPISEALNQWTYSSRWSPMNTHQFKAGEQIGFMVSAGDARNQPYFSNIKERSSIVLVSAPTDADAPTDGSSGFIEQSVSTPPTQGLPTDLGQLIQQIFAWSLGILGIAVFVMFFYSGFLWLTAAGNTAKIGEARSHMTNAVFGAILLLSSYLILYTINPDFVKNTVNLPGLGDKK